MLKTLLLKCMVIKELAQRQLILAQQSQEESSVSQQEKQELLGYRAARQVVEDKTQPSLMERAFL